jgi:hypothetical protein
MNRILILSMLILSVSCNHSKTPNAATPKTVLASKPTEAVVTEPAVAEKLQRHFEQYGIKPSITIQNSAGNTTEIQLGNHKIQWLDTDNETKIKIDHDVFTLKDQLTLNNVEDAKDSVDFANHWDQIKLFKHHQREYIGIRMSFDPCTGLGCSVDYYLIYDVKTKTQNYFGTFRTSNELELFDFGNDDKIDYVSRTYTAGSDGAAEEVSKSCALYSIENTGRFKLQLDDQKKPYFIRQVFDAQTDKEKENQFEQHWIVPIQ